MVAQSSLGQKIFILLILQYHSPGSQGRRNLETGTEAEATEEHCLLAGSHSLFSLLLYTTQDHVPRGGPAHCELEPSTSIISQSTDLPISQSDGGVFSVELPLPKYPTV